MKKLLICLITFMLVLTPIIAPTTVAFAKTENVDSVAYDYLVDFVTKEENNVSEYELRQQNRADYLVEKIKEIGYDESLIELQTVKYSNQFNRDKNEVANNIIVEKKASTPTDKYVIISANYDNAEGLIQSIQNSDGACSSGTDVATLLAVMEALKNEDLSINVKFVFFCANEIGLKGSRKFVSQMTNSEMENMMLLINLKNIGAGDYSYIYDDEIHWEHFNYFYNVSQDKNYNFNKMPVDKKVFMSYEENIGLEYVHQALLSDNAPFIAKRMPTLTMFSGNFTAKGYVQSERYGNLLGTREDTLIKFDEVFGNDGKVKMNNAVNYILDIVKDGVLVDVMQKSIASKPDYSKFTTNDKTISIVTYVIAGLIVASLIAVYFVLKDKANKSNDPIKPLYINIDQYMNQVNQMNENQGQNNHEDPFGLDDNNKNNNNDNPFGFKDNDKNNKNDNNDNPFGI